MIGKGDVSYDVFAVATLGIIPFSVLCFCSWKMLIAFKRSRQRVEENISGMSARNEEERHVTLIIIVIIMSFLILNMLFCLVSILQILNYKIESWIDLLVTNILMINHANNPVIYGLMNRNFRAAISNAFSCNKVRNILQAIHTKNDQT